MGCGECSELKRKIHNASDEASRDMFEKELDAHHLCQNECRQHYYRTRSKVIFRNKFRDVSMIIDAAGGSGTQHHPHVAQAEKGEPQRGEGLKTKATFIKIHYWGTLVLLSYPDLEGQGANLTIECLFRGLKYVYDQRKIAGITTKIRNLYVQLDNCSSNKNWALIVACAYLVVLGKHFLNHALQYTNDTIPL